MNQIAFVLLERPVSWAEAAFGFAGGASPSAIAPMRPSANSMLSRCPEPTWAAACSGWPASSRTSAKLISTYSLRPS